jgi:glyoxylase-like metal-dependent hydrolase (beta-lactamase superfamily II)
MGGIHLGYSYRCGRSDLRGDRYARSYKNWPREGGVLFVGDAAANTLGLRLSISYEDLALGKRTLAKLAALPFSVALFGHRRTIASGAAEKFARKWGTT